MLTELGSSRLCNGTEGLDVHHRTYDRVGAEELDDLTTLCDRCHTLFHEDRESGTTIVTHEQTFNEAFSRMDARRHCRGVGCQATGCDRECPALTN